MTEWMGDNSSMESSAIFYAVDLFGVFIGALTGALVARRHRYDIMGYWGLALVSGLGGGIIRDVCLQAGPPLALTEETYLPAVAVAAMLGAFFGPRIDPLRKTITVVDAIALANFAVAGSLRTIDAGLGLWPVLLMGVVTAVGGGVIRDILTGDTPLIFRRGELYALAALGTCIMVVALQELGSPREIVVPAGLVTGIGLRLGSLRYGWMSWQPR
jgi:uncharacterized membrane protein YeiH